VSMQKKEGEGGLKWGQRWLMEGSHCEAAEAMALEWKLERRRGSHHEAGAGEAGA
jgi:hypothetical protein